uniref:Uncharacterized protein n=2 Tax=Rhizophora mucronata TaxID=61149 RepID=A0A2P2IS85_RHIMU
MVLEATSQGQRKRTLEALEKRFAVAKAELLQQQKKSKGKVNEEGRKEDNNISINSSSVPSLAPVADAPKTPPSGTPSKKDTEENDLTYLQLSQPVHENLLTTNIKLQSKRGSMVDKLLHELLQHGDSAQKYMQGHRTKKVDNWILLDNYVQGSGKSTGSHDRILQAHSKRSKKHMSMKQHKKCGSFHLPQDTQKYDAFRPMHEMWKGYILQICKNAGRNQLAQCLLSADLHGAIILVAGCKVTSMVGVSGIMIRETVETFGIITEDDVLRVVPKKFSTFILQVDCWKITLHGDKLISRNLAL